MVEASIVMPIIILMVLSLILLIIHFFSCMNTQVEIHEKLINEADSMKVTYRRLSLEEEVSSKMGGLVTKVFDKRISAHYYEIREINLIRLEDKVNEFTEE